jgi:hypothetical protein
MQGHARSRNLNMRVMPIVEHPHVPPFSFILDQGE